MLVSLRSEIAKEEGIAPYMVFGDSTLLSMANTYPTDEDELLNISGVGQIKYEKYGQDFISVIEQYMVDNKIDKSTLEEDKSNVLN